MRPPLTSARLRGEPAAGMPDARRGSQLDPLPQAAARGTFSGACPRLHHWSWVPTGKDSGRWAELYVDWRWGINERTEFELPGCPPGPAPAGCSASGQSQNAPRSAKIRSRARVPLSGLRSARCGRVRGARGLPGGHRWHSPRKSGSHRTPRWREMDSNFRFRAKGATDLSFRFCLCP